MTDISLSYAITTRNKLPYLREVLGRLLLAVQDDEEIVITDGGSTDGTREYLSDLYRQGKIHYFTSEPDIGQGHGDNKAILAARGTLIKIIHDDDAFYYPGIRACKEFMLAHPEIDVLGAEGAGLNWLHGPVPHRTNYARRREQWVATKKKFSFCDLGLMIRRNSLPLLGLFHTGIRRIDYEYTLRITTGKAQLAWYTNPVWIRVLNPGREDHLSPNEGERGILNEQRANAFYFGTTVRQLVLQDFQETVRRLRARLRLLYIRWIGPRPRYPFPNDWSAVYAMCDDWLRNQNQKSNGRFLH